MRFVRSTILTLAAVAVATVATASFADEAGEKAIKARKAQMHLYSFNLGMLGAMAKEKMPYDADKAKNAAENLVMVSKLQGGAMWPKGSDSTAMPGKTRAKLDAWTTYPEIMKKSDALTTAAEALAAVAGNGLPALQGAVGGVGKSCGGCHKPFRDEKKS